MYDSMGRTTMPLISLSPPWVVFESAILGVWFAWAPVTATMSPTGVKALAVVAVPMRAMAAMVTMAMVFFVMVLLWCEVR
jgi:hypothetical protein